jgi:PAS domain S-box-containing protein
MAEKSEPRNDPTKITQLLCSISDIALSKVFWIAFIVASIISFTFYNLVQNEDYMKIEAEFNEKVENSHSKLLIQMDRYKGLLYAASTIYSALPKEKKSEWTKLIKSLSLHEKSPGHKGFTFIEKIPNEGGNSFWQQHPSSVTATQAQEKNCIITMYSKSGIYPKVLGYNVCNNPLLEKTVLQAGSTGKIKISPATPFYGNNQEKTAIMMYIPIYQTDSIPTTVEARSAQLVGWIGSPIILEALFRSVVAETNGLEFQLYQDSPEASSLLFEHIKENDNTSTLDLFANRTLKIDNQLYTIVYIKRDIGGDVTYSIPLLLLSLLFSLLSGLLIWLLYTNKERAELLADKISKSLTNTEGTVKKLLDSSPGAIYTHNNEESWTTSFVSDYFQRLTGYSPADFKTRHNFDQIIHPDDLTAARNEMTESLKEHEIYEVEYRVIKSDQNIIWVLDKGYLEKNDKGSFVRGVMFDITKTKRIEKASHQLNNALMHMAEGISLVDRKGTFVEVNPAFSRICGWDIDRVPGLQFIAMIHPEDSEEAETLFHELSQKEKVFGELRGIRQDGSPFYMSLIFVGLYDDHNQLTGAYLFVRDISEQKSSEKNLRKAKEEISIAYKTKSEFLATMSHEMRSPLNVIIGYSEMLREEVNKKAPDLAKDIEAIREAGSHLLNLVNDIIDISKLETGQTEIQTNIFDIQDVVDNVTSAVSSLISVNHNKLDVVMGGNLGLMNSDFTKIRQNLINLISNAAKFTVKGHIELSIKASGEKKEWIHFIVMDSGCGISEEKLTKIFTPFATKNSLEYKDKLGTGLGLPIVLKFCELLGGKLEVNSEVDKGSTFEMILPRGDATSEEKTPQESETEGGPLLPSQDENLTA